MPTCSAISTVLMFIPNEGSYVLAMESDKNLANDAFKRGVLLLNPTNLMLALNIVSQLWNIQNQEDHCKKIIVMPEFCMKNSALLPILALSQSAKI